MTCSSFQRIRKKIGNRMWVERFVSVKFFISYSKKTNSFIPTLKPNRILSRFLTKTSTEKFGSKVVYLNRILTFNPKSRRQHLVLPAHQYKIRETCITYVGSKLWNSLPPNIRDINLSVQCFLCKINVWLLQCRNSDYTT